VCFEPPIGRGLGVEVGLGDHGGAGSLNSLLTCFLTAQRIGSVLPVFT
jgi:hypothetical protein